MEEDLISIIVPVYNVEEYLKECIDSILIQTYKNLEIILVNDGSTDKCKDICLEYLNIDKRIKFIDKKNEGLSKARNDGIKIAKGKYLVFVDSDDYIHKNMIEILYNNLKKTNTRVSICGYYLKYSNRVEEDQEKDIYVELNAEQAIDYMNSFKYYDVSAWAKLYEKELFNNIEFPVGKKSEDWYIMYKVLDLAEKIVYDSTPLYYYRQRNTGISKNAKSINYDSIIASEQCLKFVKNKYPNIEESAVLKYLVANLGVYNMIILSKNHSDEVDKNKEKIIKSIKDNIEYVRKTKILSKFKKMQLLIFNRSKIIYNIVFKILYKIRERKM